MFLTLLKHQLTRDSTFALVRSCGNEVYKVEKSKDTCEPWELRSRNCSLTSEEFFYGPNIIAITIAKSSFTVFDNIIFDRVRADVICFERMVEQWLEFDMKRNV